MDVKETLMSDNGSPLTWYTSSHMTLCSKQETLCSVPNSLMRNKTRNGLCIQSHQNIIKNKKKIQVFSPEGN